MRDHDLGVAVSELADRLKRLETQVLNLQMEQQFDEREPLYPAWNLFPLGDHHATDRTIPA